MFGEILFHEAEIGIKNCLLTLFLKNLGVSEKEFSLEDFENLNKESGIYYYVENGKIYLKIFNTDEELEKLQKQHPITINDFFTVLCSRPKKKEKVDINEKIEEIKDLLNSLRD